MQGEDGGFHTEYDRAGSYASSLENEETASIAMIPLNSTLAYAFTANITF